MANIQLLRGLETAVAAKEKLDGQLLFTTDKGRIYLDLVNGEEITRIQLYKEDFDTLQKSIDKLNGDTTITGSVAKAIADLKTAIEGADSDTKDSKTIAGAKKYADEAVKTLNDALASVAKSGAAKDVIIADANNKITAMNVEAALEELFDSITTANNNAAVTVEESTSDSAAKVYTIKQKGAIVGTINIPKDMVVQSGAVEVNPTGQPTGTYLVLTLQNATNDKVYINVGDLIEYVTSGSMEGDMVFITVDPITHKVTAEITDGTITKAKFAQAVQDTLNLADKAVQPEELAIAAEDNKYIAGFTVAENGTITPVKTSLPEMFLTWGSF